MPTTIKKPAAAYIVTWDDNMGTCATMGWDDDCQGAICCSSTAIALFPNRAAARAAINISAKFAQLQRAQGKPHNDDFAHPARKNLRIIPCRTK